MSLLNIPIEKITIDMIKALMGNAGENRELEFKQQLNINTSNEKKEFLADIASFASASGGDIIFGIAEKDSVADKLTPLQIDEIESKRLQLEQIIRSGISPRINFTVWYLNIEKDAYILIIRIFKCFQGPVMVTFESPIRFYSRNSTGKYTLDYQQIKDGFLTANTYKDRFIKFRNERLDYLLSGELGNHPNKPFALLHVYPVSDQNFNVNSINRVKLHEYLQPFAPEFRYNIDGFLTYSGNSEYNHTQIFTNGIIEHYIEKIIYQGGFILSIIENEITTRLSRYFELYKEINIAPPFIFSLCLLNLKNASVYAPNWLYHWDFYKPTSNQLILPEIIINSFDENLDQSLKPIFDSMWRAFGVPRSMNYSDTGERIKGK